LGSKEKMQKVYVPVAQGIWWGVAKETRKERVPVARAFVEVREKPGGRVCRWFRFAQLAKGKKFRP
jgi:hypothetical protein